MLYFILCCPERVQKGSGWQFSDGNMFYVDCGGMMPGMGRVQIGTVMRGILEDHIDPQTGELNCTQLAEAAAAEFGIEGEIPERFFEVAAEFCNRGLHPAVKNIINVRDSSWFGA